MRRAWIRSLVLLTLCVWPAASSAQIVLDWELGMAQVAKDDIHVPSESGTLFSMVDDLSTEPGFAQRIQIGYLIGGRHHVSLLYVPFAMQSDGEFDRTVTFEGDTFQAGVPTLGRYKLNSGRLSYRYGVTRARGFRFRVGGSVVIRDVRVSLESSQQSASRSETDMMPLLGADARWFFSETMSGLVDIEGMALGGGRSLDALVAVDIEPADRFSFRVGYRLTTGTVDRIAIYNSFLAHQGVLGITLLI